MNNLPEIGQFYVEDVGAMEYRVAVGGFTYVLKDKQEITLETCGQNTLIKWSMKAGEQKVDTYSTKAQAMRAFADILEGQTNYEIFGKKIRTMF